MSWDDRAARRRVVGAVAIGTLVGGLLSAGPASADEIYTRPADQSVSLAGHGYGHGHGMSQWGAYGAARSGLLWPDIMSFYYPGTVRTTISQPTIRVKVTGLLGSTARVANDGNLQASFGTGHTGAWALPTAESSGAKIVDYRVELGAQSPGVPTQAVLRYRTDAGVVKTYVTAPGNQINIGSLVGAAVRGIAPNGTYISYPGEFRGVLVGSAGYESVTPVVANGLDTYLRGVVPSEMPASWSAEALKSQAVAARSYAYYELNHPENAAFDTCDTTSCQVYKGSTWQSGSTVTPIEQPSSNAAITATGNVVLTYNGASAFTQFSAANGGYMTPGSQPYLVGKADPYDGVVPNTANSWTAEISVAAIESRYPSIGLYRDMRIVSRDGNGEWGGRVQSMVLDGNSGSVTLTGASFRSAFGLRSEWFVPTDPRVTPSYPRDFNGDGKADVSAVVGSTGELRAYYGNGSGGWSGSSVIGTGFSQYASVFTAGTWDADAFSDVMAISGSGDLSLYSGTGGALAAPRVVGHGWTIYNAVFPVGDFSGDGLPDLLARKPDGTLWLYRGDGQGGFQNGVTQVGAGWNIFTSIFSTGDFDGDGRMDVVARTSDGRLLLYPGNGAGGWKARRQIGAGWNAFSSIMSSGDFTGDRASDIVARGWDGTLWLYPGNGQGGFQPRRGIGAGWNIFSSILP